MATSTIQKLDASGNPVPVGSSTDAVTTAIGVQPTAPVAKTATLVTPTGSNTTVPYADALANLNKSSLSAAEKSQAITSLNNAYAKQAQTGYDPTRVSNPTGPSSSSTVTTNNNITTNTGNATSTANGEKTPLSAIQSRIMSTYGFDEDYVRSLSPDAIGQFGLSLRSEDIAQQDLDRAKQEQDNIYRSDLAKQNAEYAQARADLAERKTKDIDMARATSAQLNPYSGANTDENNYMGSINNAYSKLEEQLANTAAQAKAALDSGNYKAYAAINSSMAKIKSDGIANIQSMLTDLHKTEQQDAQFNQTLDVNKKDKAVDNYKNFLAAPTMVPSSKMINAMTDEELSQSSEFQTMAKTQGLTVKQFRADLLTAAKTHDQNSDNKDSIMNARNENLSLREQNLALQQDKFDRGTSGADALTATRWINAANKLVVNDTILKTQLKNLGGASGYLSRIEAAKTSPGSVSDQQLLDAFTQLDTGGNRVTEAQVNLILKGRSLKDWTSVVKNKFDTGGILSTEQREQIQKLSKEVYKNYQDSYIPAYQKAVSRFKQAGIPESYWSIPSPDNLSSASEITAIQESPTAGTTTSGVGWTIEQ